MGNPLITVLVLTYKPKKEALFATLRSITAQKDCDFEIVVADDGSADFFEGDVRAFLADKGIDHTIVPHAENQGTVRNIIDGVTAARGKYIKPISPGDLLYDATTLRDIGRFMEERDAKAAFGRMVFYAFDPELQVKNLAYPCLDSIYRTNRYNCKKILKHQMVFNDFLSGASAVYEKETFLQGLQTVTPAVRYAEDTVFQVFAMDGIQIHALDRLIVWYEHGSGISTQKTAQTFTRIDEDFYNFYHLMVKRYPRSRYAKRACRTWELRKAGDTKKLLCSKLRPDRILFTLRARLQKRQQKQPPYNADFFLQCHHE